MNDKYLKQFNNAKASIKLLYKQISISINYNELNQVLTNFNTIVQKQANQKNNRPNKHIIGIGAYYINSIQNKRNIKPIVQQYIQKNINYKSSYKDYLSEFKILKERGYSYRKISNYAKQYYGITVSKDTISKILKELK